MNTRTITDILVKKYATGVLLDVGAGYGRYKEMIAPHVDKYRTSDGFDVRADFVEDSAHLTHADGVFDTVLCNQALERVVDAEGTISELYRVLKPGGYAIATVPFLFPEHKDPTDFRRYTRDGLVQMFSQAGFIIVECRGYGSVWDIIAESIKMSTRNPYLPRRNLVVRKFGYYAIKIFEFIGSRSKHQISDSSIYYPAVYIVARK